MNIAKPEEIWNNLKLDAAEVRRRDQLRAIHVPRTVIEAIVQGADKTMVTEKELTAIKRLDAEWARVRSLILSHTEQAARELYQKSKNELEKAVRSGGKLPSDNWSSADFQEDFEKTRRRAKNVIRDITTESVTHLVKIANRFACAAEDLAARVERSEEIEFEKFGVPYVPSALVWTIRAAGFQIFHRLPVPGVGGNRPASILAGIIEIETEAGKP